MLHQLSLSPSQIDYFYTKVHKTDDCWPWIGPRFPNGYGQIRIRAQGIREAFLTHRVAYELAFGPIPEGLVVCHKCDNPPCCNPSHLFVGTQRTNVLDSISKGRYGDHSPINPSRGTQHYLSFLSNEDVLSIRHLYAQGGIGMASLGRMYSAATGTIQKILNGTTWKHLPILPPGERSTAALKPAIGEGHGRHKLSLEQAIAVRTAVGTQKDIAIRFGISQGQVCRIRTGKNWATAIQES